MTGALDLLIGMEDALVTRVPLAGGWHSAPMPGQASPYGTFFVTDSRPRAGGLFTHSGIVNVWCRADGDDAGNAQVRQAFTLSAAARNALHGGAFPVPEGLTLHDFNALEVRRMPLEDGLWRGFFTFTAITTGGRDG